MIKVENHVLATYYDPGTSVQYYRCQHCGVEVFWGTSHKTWLISMRWSRSNLNSKGNRVFLSSIKCNEVIIKDIIT